MLNLAEYRKRPALLADWLQSRGLEVIKARTTKEASALLMLGNPLLAVAVRVRGELVITTCDGRLKAMV